MKLATDKPVAAIRFEGCLEDENGDYIELAAERARELARDGKFLLIVSPKAATLSGVRYLTRFLSAYDIPYDQIWEGWALPEIDEWYDPNACDW